ncbi:hypothetical protein SDC9_82994 [bioreactor metagenome]|uniref:Uncharacterized protein n=1 Tax=bioreactor metagenome TaxID=1076179 RepID=A0A644Z7Y9_9ZZZZ
MNENQPKKKSDRKKDGKKISSDVVKYRDNPGAATGGLMFTKSEILDITKGVDSTP